MKILFADDDSLNPKSLGAGLSSRDISDEIRLTEELKPRYYSSALVFKLDPSRSLSPRTIE
jgi:hypothetical protein